MNAIIQTRNLSKSFPKRTARNWRPKVMSGVWQGLLMADWTGLRQAISTQTTNMISAIDDVSLTVQEGECVGYLGPNGAGKSTMIKIMTGILVPTSGSISVLGRTPHENRVENARQFGSVFGQRSQLWWDLQLHHSFELHRRIYGVDPLEFRMRRGELIEAFDLLDILDRPVRLLSLGQRMRAEIAMALMHNPKLLFLDEPTIGLDLVAKDRLRTYVRRANRDLAVTVIITSHDLKDIEEVCTRIVVVNEGSIVFDGPISSITAKLGYTKKVQVTFDRDPGNINLLGAQEKNASGPVRHFLFDDAAPSILSSLKSLDTSAQLVDIKIEDPGVEDIIRKIYANWST